MSDNHRKTLETLPSPTIFTYSLSVLERDSGWWHDRIGKRVTEHWIVSSVTPYDTEGYKFARINLVRWFPPPRKSAWNKLADFVREEWRATA